MIGSIKALFIKIKQILFPSKNNKELLPAGEVKNEIDTKEKFYQGLINEEVKILDIKSRVEKGQIKLEELTRRQQEVLLKVYQKQKKDLEDSISRLNYQLNKND